MSEHRYRICVAGGLGPASRHAFAGFEICPRGADTELIGVLDQPTLYQILAHIQNLALELVAVSREERTPAARVLAPRE
ncbi:MAG: hypothetical protein JWO63_917 [Frankiales bacterium]|nr:hypothetical protein [Frankiales bacterium]